MAIVFSNSGPKISKLGIFGLEFRDFYFFNEILQLDKFEGTDFKYDNGFLEFQSEITQIKKFLS